MKFIAGVLLGLLLAGPGGPDAYYNITEINRYNTVSEEEPAVIYNPVPLEVELIDGDEWCVIEMLDGPGGDWDAADVLAILDEAWLHYDGPCDMMERKDD